MSTSQRGDWQRVSKRRPCPVCGKPDWCVYTGGEDAPEAVLCQRVESPKRIGEAGWLHKLRDSTTAWPRWQSTLRRAVRMMQPEAPALDFARLANESQAAAKPEALERFARSLGLTPDSLRRLGVGWVAAKRAWGFPMKDASGRMVGIRLRLTGGRKLSVRGGREGLFYPTDLDPRGRLLITEGPTDCAALLDLRFQVVGRPSCRGGVAHLAGLVKRLRPVDVAIVADGDGPGQDGAERLAATLAAGVPDVRVITPPDGVIDARAWKRAGATPSDVQEAIEAAEPRRLALTATIKAGGQNGRR